MSDFNFPDSYATPISETHFRDVYLPGLMAADDEVALLWINDIARLPSAPVRVVSDDDKEKVLFTVPPLVRTPTTSNGQVNTLINLYHKATDGHHPKAVKKTFDDVLASRFQSAGMTDGDRSAWLAIAKRYGYSVPDSAVADESITSDVKGDLSEQISYQVEDWD